LSWMIEVWTNNHLVSDGNLQHQKVIIPKNIYKGMTNIVGLTFSPSDNKCPMYCSSGPAQIV